MFLEARKFNLGDVYARTSTLESIEDVFAADMMCHKSCINNYLVKHKRIVSNEQLSKEMTCDEQKFAFSNMISKLDIEKRDTLYLDAEVWSTCNLLKSCM